MKEEIKNPKMGAVKGDRDALINDFYGIQTERENPNSFYGAVTGTQTLQQVVMEMEGYDPILPGIFEIIESILGFKRIIEEGKDKRITTMVREAFAEAMDYTVFRHLLHAVKYGFSPIEFEWYYSGNRWMWKKVKDWSPSRMTFGAKNEMLRIKDDGTKVPVDEKTKFKVLSYNGKYGNRFGESKYDKLYYHGVFARDNRLWWNIFNERSASPHVVITAEGDASMSPADHEAAVKFIKDMKQHTGLVLDVPAAVTLLQANTAAGKNYDSFITHLNRDKSMLLTGTPAAAEVVKSGSYAKEKVTSLLRDDIRQGYIKQLETFVNDEVIPLLVGVNFGSAVQKQDMPKWRIKVPQVADDGLKFMTTMSMAAKHGAQIPISFINEKLGIPEAQPGEPVLTVPKAEEMTKETNFAYQQYQIASKAWMEDVKALEEK